MKKVDNSQDIIIAGIEARLPGLRYARTQIDQEIKKYEALVRGIHGNGSGVMIDQEPEEPEGRPVRPMLPAAVVLARKRGGKVSSKNYWSKLTPQQRSAEMRRRIKIRKTAIAPVIAAANLGPDWVTTQEAMKQTKVAESTIRKWRIKGDLEAKQTPGPTGSRFMVNIKQALELAANLRRGD